ncbi:MAG: MATE family efflux transporter [Clostridia bacterium]|nr:MATE family efflux transporter [Clostridia bacterium]
MTENKEKSFLHILLTLALPIAIQNLLTSSFTLVDTLMVGSLGDVPLAAVGMAGQWSWLLNMITFGICSGASVFFAQYFGEKNKRGIVHTYGLSLALGLAVAFFFMLVGLFLPEGVIRIFNREPAVVSAGTQYLKIAVFSYPAILLNMLINTVLRSTGRVRLPMVVSFFTTILNAILDYGLIFGAFGLPRLGISGAAIATVISAWSGPVIIFTITAFMKDEIFFAPIKELFGFSKSFSVSFLKKAAPVVLNETLWGLGTVIYSVIFSNMGYEYSAAVSVFRTFENIALAFLIGLINAASVIVGQDIGSGNLRSSLKNAARFMVAVPVLSLFIGSLFIIFRTPLVSFFDFGGNLSEKTLSAARAIFVVSGIELAIRNVPYVAICGVFRAGGDTKTGTKYELVTLWAISVPMTFLAAFVIKLPFIAVFTCSLLCEDVLKSILCLKHYKSNRWIKPVTDTGKKALEEYLSN